MAKSNLSLDQFDYVLGFLGQALDFTPALEGIEQLIIGATKEGFDQETDPDGNKWKPLKRPRFFKKGRRKRRRLKSKTGDQILNDTGLLRASTTAIGSPGNVSLLTKTSVEVGTEIPYAATHNYGDPRRNIPQRQFLGLNDETEEDIEQLVGDFIEREIAERIG